MEQQSSISVPTDQLFKYFPEAEHYHLYWQKYSHDEQRNEILGGNIQIESFLDQTCLVEATRLIA